MTTQGTWTLRSDSNPKWNCSGRGDVGGLVIPKDCKERVTQLTELLGPPPADLTWNYMKD